MSAWITIALLVLSIVILGLLMWVLMQRQAQLYRKMEEQASASKVAQEVLVAQNDDRFDFLISQIQEMNKGNLHQDHILDQLADQTRQMAMTMGNAKLRGNWGETQMEMLIEACLGQSDALFERQYTLANGKIADGVFFVPGSQRLLCIDSKFPLDNYMRMESDPKGKKAWEKELVKNIRKHISDIQSKYITEQTEPYALMFVPSEALYAFICSKSELLQMAWASHVLLVSPTTLSGVLFSLKGASQDFYRAEHMEEIEQGLRALQKDMKVFAEHSAKVRRQAESLNASIQALDKDANRLEERFEKTVEGVSHGRDDSQG